MFRTREFNVLHAASTASGETQGQVHVSRHAVYNTHSDSRVTEGQVHCHELEGQETAGQGVRPSDPLVGEPVEPQRHPRRTQGTPKENLRKIPASSALGLIGIVYFVYSASISALMG